MVIAAVIALTIAGCQHAPEAYRDKSSMGWRVLERVGQARMVHDDSPASELLRPGETLGHHTQVINGRGALLILQKDGVQITAGEETSFRLPEATANSSLDLARGWLRLRLATAANQKTRVKTAHFDINTANATLTLRATPEGSDLTVEAGSITLATTDGLHHATLVAGAAAKMERASGDDLLIRKASGRPFTRVAPLPAEPAGQASEPTPSAPIEIPVEPVAEQPSMKAPPPPISAAAASDLSTIKKDVVILPASRPSRVDMPIPEMRLPEDSGRLPSGLSSPAPRRNAPLAAIARPSFAEPITRPAIAEPATRPSAPARAILQWSADPIVRPADSSDPLQVDFDRLTEGLIDGL